MSISFKRYVDITSGVIGANVVAVRQLIGRIFTNSLLLPPQSYIEFTNAADVGTYFGTSSAEYARALYYFAYISKRLSKPQRLSFARYVDVAVAPRIYGTTAAKLLATYTAISAGTFDLTLGGVTNTIGPVNLSGAASLAAVATLIQTAIQAKVGAMWTAATVSYNAPTNQFNLVGGTTGAANIAIVEGAQGLGAALGWIPVNPYTLGSAVLAPGSAVETIAGTLDASFQASANFGSFLFIPTMTQQNVVDAATWNATKNVMFMYCQGVSAANAAAWYAAAGQIAGTAVTLSPIATEYPEMLPMMNMAATDYAQTNATSNYMFTQSQLTPSVANDVSADSYDSIRVNYYGQTAVANPLSFYQRGIMWGPTTSPNDQNTYANECWLKSAAASAFMNLLIALPTVPANQIGRGALLNQLQDVIQTAKRNGVISVGKILNSTQIAAVTNLTGSPNAWYQVQGQGFWLDLVIESYVNNQTQLTEYRALYTLVYSKDDAIRKVVGTHALV